MLRWRYVLPPVIAALCAVAVGGSASAGGSTGAPKEDAAPPIDQPQPDRVVREVDLQGQSPQEWLRSHRDEIISEEELAERAEQTRRVSSGYRYYPDAPDDSRMNPPELDDQGEEEN